MDYRDVTDHSSRGARFDLDSITESVFMWMPYGDSAHEAFVITDDEISIMSAPSPLMFEHLVEWCYTDRVTRQFGFVQMVPTTSPHQGHFRFHGPPGKWPISWSELIDLWFSRGLHKMEPPLYRPKTPPVCGLPYFEWYDRVTRRFIINPTVWSEQRGFQGTQGNLPMAVSISLYYFHSQCIFTLPLIHVKVTMTFSNVITGGADLSCLSQSYRD